MQNAARIVHELTEIRDDLPWFAMICEIFSHDSYKKAIHADNYKKAIHDSRGISSKMNVPQKAAVDLILQLECWKQFLI